MNGLGHYMSHYFWHCLCINLAFQFVIIPFTGINICIIPCFVLRVVFTCMEEEGFGYGQGELNMVTYSTHHNG